MVQTKYILSDVDEINGFYMSTESTYRKKATNQIEVKVINKSDEKYFYSQQFTLEVNLNGVWYQVPMKEDIIIEDMGFYSMPDAERAFQINLDNYTYLPKGDYRCLNKYNDSLLEVKFKIN